MLNDCFLLDMKVYNKWWIRKGKLNKPVRSLVIASCTESAAAEMRLSNLRIAALEQSTSLQQLVS